MVGEELASPLVETWSRPLLRLSALWLTWSHTGLARWVTPAEALSQDLEAFSEGARPKKWKAAQLLEGDGQRWALARAACGYAQTAPGRCEQQLDRVEIAATASTLAAGQAKLWAEASEAGWLSRLDRAVAYQHYRRAGQHLADFLAAGAVIAWARRETSAKP